MIIVGVGLWYINLKHNKETNYIMSVTITDSYQYYRTVSTEAGFHPRPIYEYNKIISQFMQFIVDKIIDEGVDIRLPYALGYLGIRGKKVRPSVDEEGNVKGLAPSWSKTRELWKVDPIAKENKQFVYCFNEHSDGIRYRLIWWKKKAIFINKVFYRFTFSFDNKRRIHKNIMEGAQYTLLNRKNNIDEQVNTDSQEQEQKEIF